MGAVVFGNAPLERRCVRSMEEFEIIKCVRLSKRSLVVSLPLSGRPPQSRLYVLSPRPCFYLIPIVATTSSQALERAIDRACAN